MMSNWNGTIIGPGHVSDPSCCLLTRDPRSSSPPSAPQTVHENRIYSLKITCGQNYPEQPPEIQFLSRVNLPFVSQLHGKVEPSKLSVLDKWQRSNSLETVLVEIRKCVIIDRVCFELGLQLYLW